MNARVLSRVDGGSVVPVRDAAQMVAGAFRVLDEATGPALVAALGNVGRMQSMLDALVGQEAEHQRAFRRSVIAAITRLQPGQHAPQRFGLIVIQAGIKERGPRPALDLIDASVEPPRWSDIVRMYRPEYGQGNPMMPAALKAAGKKNGPRRFSPRDTPAPSTRAELDKRVATYARRVDEAEERLERDRDIFARATELAATVPEGASKMTEEWRRTWRAAMADR